MTVRHLLHWPSPVRRGREAERQAERYRKRLGLAIVARSYRRSIDEIELVMLDDATLGRTDALGRALIADSAVNRHGLPCERDALCRALQGRNGLRCHGSVPGSPLGTRS